MADDKSISKYSDIFSKKLPNTAILFVALFVMSAVVGMVSVAILHYNLIGSRPFATVLLNGTLAGSIAILLPAVLTVFIVKATRHIISVKHTLFIAIIGAASYSVFFLLGSVLQVLAPGAAAVALIVGDASIFGWWFFINKVVLGFRKRALIFALAQPTLNIILFFVASRFIFSLNSPFPVILFKLYVGILIFVIVSYMLLFMFDRPLKKNLGTSGVDVFSTMLQNWLFDINTALSFNTKLGIKPDVETNTFVIKNGSRTKAVLFIPEIHYGPAGSLGASNFPYLLEERVRKKYMASGFIMHTAVTADRNPISTSQISRVQAALDNGVAKGTQLKGTMSYSEGSHLNCRVIRLALGGWSIVTFTRAPYVTEDIAFDSATLFKKTLARKYGESIIIDAHNSRYESAPKSELDGVRFDSKAMKDYVKAIDSMKEKHRGVARVGVHSVEAYNALGAPKDLAQGNLNVAIFSFGNFKYAIFHFNSNNLLPSLRSEIISYIKKKYRIHAEVYTTDTHAVNSLEYTAENVLGRYTKFKSLKPLIDQAVGKALADIGPVRFYHKRVMMNRFPVWGPEVGDIILDMTKTVVSRARVLSPIIIASGFIVAAFVIAFV